MKQLKLVLAAVLISVLTGAISAERSSPAPFRIEVDLSGSEAKMRCKAGCAWTATSYSCGTDGSCSFVLDEAGVEGIAAAAGR
jgi:hypothetical protein